MLVYNLKLDFFILTTLVYSAELLTDFSYTNFIVSCREMLWTDSVFSWTLSCCFSDNRRAGWSGDSGCVGTERTATERHWNDHRMHKEVRQCWRRNTSSCTRM